MTVFVPRTIRSVGRLLRSQNARKNAVHEWRRRLGTVPALPPSPIARVLVLCHGNICRSPFAASYLAQLRPDLEIASAGLQAGEGSPADPTAQRVATRFGVDLSAHRSRPIRAGELDRTDLVLAMEGHHHAELVRRSAAAARRTRLLGHYLPQAPYELPDPWGRPEAEFEAVFARIRESVDALAARIPKEGA